MLFEDLLLLKSAFARRTLTLARPYSLREAQIIIENWRKHHNTKRPHSALGYCPPAPEVFVPID
ncbi:transposase [Ruegeria atlantica]|uniref:transposase n=1 Tax=Ruegeria atlantica TaxID=81569 RepID=UPI0021BBECCA|nr:transposase [Ruegeria atlantica]